MAKTSTRVLRSAVATASALSLGLGFALVPQTASARTANVWCNSKNSAHTFSIKRPNGSLKTAWPNSCHDPGENDKVIMGADSYRVGYNLKSYGKCIPGNATFTPWRGADIIYFRTYRFSKCRN